MRSTLRCSRDYGTLCACRDASQRLWVCVYMRGDSSRDYGTLCACVGTARRDYGTVCTCVGTARRDYGILYMHGDSLQGLGTLCICVGWLALFLWAPSPLFTHFRNSDGTDFLGYHSVFPPLASIRKGRF